jgi:hypothetical protein
MNTNKMYKEMTFYLEACESGSMFENILENSVERQRVTSWMHIILTSCVACLNVQVRRLEFGRTQLEVDHTIT